MKTDGHTSDFIELHEITDPISRPMKYEPITVNKHHIICIFNTPCRFDADWDIGVTDIKLTQGISITVTETYEEIKEMLKQ